MRSRAGNGWCGWLLLGAILLFPHSTLHAESALNINVTVTVNGVSNTIPEFLSATTNDADGDGSIDELTVAFTVPVNITDAGGAGDGFDVITLSGGYIIADGDYTASNTTSMTLQLVEQGSFDTGITVNPTYDVGGSSLIRNIYQPIEVDDGDTVLGDDGAKPLYYAVAPASNSSADDVKVSYSVSEDLASGSITWTRTGGKADPRSPHVQDLIGDELDEGSHNEIIIANAPFLTEGAIYSITWNGVDLVGNVALPVTRTNITFSAIKPVITSEPMLYTVEGDRWTYNIAVNTNALATRAGHRFVSPYNLLFSLGAGAPVDSVIRKTNTNKATLTWDSPIGHDTHVRFIVVCTDTYTDSSDTQEILLHVIDLPFFGA